MNISDLKVSAGLLNICTEARAASLDFYISSSATEPTDRTLFSAAILIILGVNDIYVRLLKNGHRAGSEWSYSSFKQ